MTKPTPSKTQQALGPYLELLALMSPAARFVLRQGLPLAWAKKAFEASVLQQSKLQGFSLRELGDALNIGPSKTFSLARLWRRELPQRLLNDGAKDPEPLGTLIQAILTLGPLSPAKLNQFLPDFKYSEIQTEIRRLLSENALQKQHGLLSLPAPSQATKEVEFFDLLTLALQDPTKRRALRLSKAQLEQWLESPEADWDVETEDVVHVCISWCD